MRSFRITCRTWTGRRRGQGRHCKKYFMGSTLERGRMSSNKKATKWTACEDDRLVTCATPNRTRTSPGSQALAPEPQHPSALHETRSRGPHDHAVMVIAVLIGLPEEQLAVLRQSYTSQNIHTSTPSQSPLPPELRPRPTQSPRNIADILVEGSLKNMDLASGERSRLEWPLAAGNNAGKGGTTT